MLIDNSEPFRPRPDGTPPGAGEGSCFHATTQRRNEARGTTTLQNLSYTWDAKTNLKSRGDSLAGTSEIFAYDKLNRLISTTDGASSISNYTYAPNGNLLSKPFLSGVSYGGSRPHAITAATVRGISRSYTYGAAGRVTSDGERSYQWTSFGQLLQVTQLSTPLLKTFDPTQRYVIAGTPPSGIPGIPTAQQYQASLGTATFEFDASGSRWKQDLLRTYVGGGTARLTTLYLGSYERETLTTQATGGSTPVLQKTLHRHQLGTAIYTVEEKPGIAPVIKLDALLTDHLGSTDVILAATWNGTQWSGFQAERQSADTWATQRTQSSDPRVTSGADYHRGFTGHEMLDDFGLIHMNGRIYDPEIGRFLSCDPYVQVPEFSQNFNRYTYVLNNPLTFTDPSGHQINGVLAAVISIAVCVVAWYAAPAILGAFGASSLAVTGSGASLSALAAQGVVAGFIAGAANAAINGGSGGDILKGAAVGAISGAICGGVLHGLGADGSLLRGVAPAARAVVHIVGHGIVGGLSNAALGGRFQDGFLSGGLSTLAFDMGISEKLNLGESGDWSDPGKVFGRTIVAGIIGGTASALGGGKFANGAFTAAFQHFLNAEFPTKGGVKIELVSKAINADSQLIYGFKFTLDGETRYLAFNDKYGIIAPQTVDLAANFQLASEHSGPTELNWFKDQVRNKGPWDYKQMNKDFQNFGNFHYGFVAKAAGISEEMALKQAGRAQVAAGTSLPSFGEPAWGKGLFGGSGTYGDDPVDSYYIKQGYNAGWKYQAGKAGFGK